MRRRVLKWLRIISIILIVCIILGAGGATWFVRRPWPQTSGTINVAGLSSQVQVLRDSFGVPQIYAQNERDLFFAQGYVHAQDRLWQMEFNRHVGSGSVSSVVGAATLELDRHMRTLGLRRAAEKDWAILDAPTREILESYAAGVNAYIESHRSQLPVEFTILGVDPQPWTPIDSLVWGKVMSLNLGFNYLWEILRARLIGKLGQEAAYEIMTPFDPKDPDASNRTLPPLSPELENFSWLAAGRGRPAIADQFLGPPTLNIGSNSWVVHGSRTATGKPILANDTHLFLGIPSVWYGNGLHAGDFNAVGFSFPGVPLVVIGSNSRIAWGTTNLPADVQDLYIERLDDPANPTQYFYQEQWQPLDVIEETIEVKGQPAEQLKVYLTRHGPIINSVEESLKDARPIALRWTALDGSLLLQAINMMNRAGNWDEFRAAAENWHSPNQNFVYADVDGNIGYQMVGRIPLRSAGHTGDVPVPSWAGTSEWTGFIPFAELPSSFNPPAGFLATANSKPADRTYPYHLSSEWAAHYRVQRITDLLSTNQQVSIADTQAIQAQTYSLPAEALRPYLLEIAPENELQTQALEAVRNWDLYLEADRVGATVYQAWFWFLIQNMFEDDLGEELLLEYNLFSLVYTPNFINWMERADTSWFDDVTTPEKEDRAAIVRRSFTEALDWLQQNYGADPSQWQWGRTHSMRFRHQPIGQSGIPIVEGLFNSSTFPARGDDHTVNAGWFSPVRPFRMIGGTAERLIVDLSNLDNTLAINSTGQSGHLFHAHRTDMVTMWQEGQYYPFHFNKPAVEAITKETLLLSPQQ